MHIAGMAELVDAHDSKSCGVTHESSILSLGTMTDNNLIKISTACLLLSLLLIIFGVSNSFEILRWSVLAVTTAIVIICLRSRRYYWGILFVIFGIIFNPWVHPRFSRMEWTFIDILLSTSLVIWYFDYFRNYHKGLLFEQLVQNKFPKQEYVLVSATKDLHKKLKRFVESDANPDFVFREKTAGKTFAVECKYRSSYATGNRGDDGIWWDKIQGERYLRYSQQKNIPVYVAIGIEGNPKSPKIIALIPIDVIQKSYFKFIPKKVIEQYPLTSIK